MTSKLLLKAIFRSWPLSSVSVERFQSPSIFNRSFCLKNRNFSSECKMQIKEGDAIPDIVLFEDDPSNEINIKQLCCSKNKVVIFAVPGAFTPGCSNIHLPSYLEHFDEIKKSGIDEIVCISVNDPFVMGAWGAESKCCGKIRMLADTTACFSKAIGLTIEVPVLGGLRSRRYSMIVEKGIVKSLQVEPDGFGLTCSLAKRLKL